MKIIFALDPFTSAEWALEALAERSWPPGTVVRVLAVVNQIAPSAAELWFDARGDINSVRASRRERAAEATTRAVDFLVSKGLAAEQTVLDGTPHRAIVIEAREWAADLIVLAPHRKRIAGTLTTSVSAAVLNYAPCSVEVLRPKTTHPSAA